MTPCRVVANIPDCDIVVSEFELNSRYYIHFRINNLGKSHELLIPPHHSYVSSITFTVLLQEWVFALNKAQRLICY